MGAKNKRTFKDYEVEIKNHSLMIMAKERRVDLLQHPLCLAITFALNLFILSSDSPLDWPEKFNCSGKVDVSVNNEEGEDLRTNRLRHLNKYFRIILLLLNVARLVFFFVTQE